MIDSTSSPDRAARFSSVSPAQLKAPPSRTDSPADSLSTDKAESLRMALANQPEIRPEVVARGQALAADPNYPSSEAIDQISSLIVNSPDLSEDQS